MRSQLLRMKKILVFNKDKSNKLAVQVKLGKNKLFEHNAKLTCGIIEFFQSDCSTNDEGIN